MSETDEPDDLVEYAVSALRHRCAERGPCSDVVDGCSCTDTDLLTRALLARTPTVGDDLDELVKSLRYGDQHASAAECRNDLCNCAIMEEAATALTTLRERVAEAEKLNNKYAWERDKARDERNKAEARSEAFWKAKVELLEGRVASLTDALDANDRARTAIGE